MKSIVLIIPYFGTLPDYFPVWKQSALANPTVDFLFFTDIDALQDEQNIKTHHLSFEDFKALIQKKFDFPITLDKPYKLCDYKPTYGYVLQEYIKEYDFWGHCDVDLIFGDIRHFITDDILEKHQKILEHGHFTLYRNDGETNTVFMRCPGYGDYDYKKAFTSGDAMYFDEFLGTMLIFRKESIPTYYDLGCFFQISPLSKNFRYKYKGQNNAVFQYADGKLSSVCAKGDRFAKEELMYVHFQKRKIDCSQYTPCREFYMTPNKIVPGRIALSNEMFRVRGECCYRLKIKLRHCRDFLRAYRKSRYRSFIQYRKSRKVFRGDMADAKRLLREYKSTL